MSTYRGTTTPEGAREFLQERLTFFAKWIFLIWGTLVVSLVAMYAVFPETAPQRLSLLYPFTISALVALGSTWFFMLRRRALSNKALQRIDVAYVLLVATDFGLTAFLSSDRGPNVYSAFIWCVFMLFARALIVPGSARRTAAVSSIALAPLLAASVATGLYHSEDLIAPMPAFVAGVCIFSAAAVALATIATLTSGSGVIFRLRRQVHKAQQLGQYTLEEKIGEGGMGAVYRARHALLRRQTAIKLLPPDRLGEENVRRFEREVQLTSALTHPNTVEIYDYGRSPDGVFYYVMEYLDGIDLERLVRTYGPQPAARVAHILAQVCAALGEAHRREIIHRDIKPGNIILCTRGDVPDVVKVVDFGLVKELDDESVATARNAVIGTPAYLSPEAITDPDDVGPSSDLYAVGAVGYFLSSGCTVFEGKTAIDVCSQHVTGVPKAPSQRGDTPIPEALERVILECLEKSPADRPDDATTLARRLRTLEGVDSWSEDAAQTWWSDFRQLHGGVEGSTGQASETYLLDRVTMTVDLSARA